LSRLGEAIALAADVHRDQVDKADAPLSRRCGSTGPHVVLPATPIVCKLKLGHPGWHKGENNLGRYRWDDWSSALDQEQHDG
jgi:hypothetical protein